MSCTEVKAAGHLEGPNGYYKKFSNCSKILILFHDSFIIFVLVTMRARIVNDDSNLHHHHHNHNGNVHNSNNNMHLRKRERRVRCSTEPSVLAGLSELDIMCNRVQN